MTHTPFIHLRARSPYSLLEGAIKISRLSELCVEQHMPAIALTDSTNLCGALEFSKTISGAGVQPIIGCTLPVRVRDIRPGETSKPDGSIVLLAQSETGYLNLMELSSAAYLEVASHEAPHLTLERLLTRPDGLICLTGGYEGALNTLIRDGRQPLAQSYLEQLTEAFKDRLYIELQRHNRPEDIETEAWLVEQAYDRAIPLVATNEPYFAKREDYKAHDALMCISDGTYVTVDDRRKLTEEHYFKTADEMRALFSDLPEAIENTHEIARRCAYAPDTRDPILPNFPTGKGRNEAEELRLQAREGLNARLEKVEAAAPREDYDKRLDYELDIIERMGFPGYFLIVSDFIKWAKDQDIPVGPGRGSGAGSLVAWSLTITDLDPLRFGLLFERFLNPERVSMPDFDIDFCQERRGEVIRYVKEQYGDDRVAQIITFGTLQARAVVRDVGRVLQLPFPVVDRIAKLVPFNPANPVTLAEAVQSEPKLLEMKKQDSAVEQLLDVALQLEGLFRNASTHAAGVVIGDRPLTDLVPLYRDPRSPLPATQFNMKWVEPAGLVKFDFLGLKTLTVIARALEYIRTSTGDEIDLDTLGFEDEATYELLASGHAIGVFQLESSGMRDTLRKVKPDSIEDIIALISLYRPGPMKNIDVYVERKFGADVDYLHPDLKPVLEETYGVIIYQEQVMQIAQILSGYSLGEADLLRRAMGKKKKDEMDKQRVRFLEGAEERGVSREKANYIFDLVAEFAGYGFNKSHAAAYAVLAYRTAWLKANYPVQFMAALMSLDIANTDKLAQFYQECRRMELEVRGPDINEAEADFSVEGEALRYALGAIKNVGFSAMKHVVDTRVKTGPYKDIFDFAERVDPREVNKRTMENLARAGSFDDLEPDRATATSAADVLIALAQSAQSERDSAQTSLFGGGDAGPSRLERPRLPSIEPWDATRQLDEELQAVGFYISGHPLDSIRDELQKRRTVFHADLAELVEDGHSAARLAGVVRKCQERRSQRNGDKYAFLTLSDPTGEFEALVPGRVLSEIRDDLEPGNILIVNTRLDAQEGDLRLIIDSAEPISVASLDHDTQALRIVLDNTDNIDKLSTSMRRCDDRSQAIRGSIYLVVTSASGATTELKLPGDHAVDAAARALLKQTEGVALIENLGS